MGFQFICRSKEQFKTREAKRNLLDIHLKNLSWTLINLTDPTKIYVINLVGVTKITYEQNKKSDYFQRDGVDRSFYELGHSSSSQRFFRL